MRHSAPATGPARQVQLGPYAVAHASMSIRDDNYFGATDDTNDGDSEPEIRHAQSSQGVASSRASHPHSASQSGIIARTTSAPSVSTSASSTPKAPGPHDRARAEYERSLPALRRAWVPVLQEWVRLPQRVPPGAIDLSSKGIPPAIRGAVWARAAGNSLQVTADLYQACLQRANLVHGGSTVIAQIEAAEDAARGTYHQQQHPTSSSAGNHDRHAQQGKKGAHDFSDLGFSVKYHDDDDGDTADVTSRSAAATAPSDRSGRSAAGRHKNDSSSVDNDSTDDSPAVTSGGSGYGRTGPLHGNGRGRSAGRDKSGGASTANEGRGRSRSQKKQRGASRSKGRSNQRPSPSSDDDDAAEETVSSGGGSVNSIFGRVLQRGWSAGASKRDVNASSSKSASNSSALAGQASNGLWKVSSDSRRSVIDSTGDGDRGRSKSRGRGRSPIAQSRGEDDDDDARSPSRSRRPVATRTRHSKFSPEVTSIAAASGGGTSQRSSAEDDTGKDGRRGKDSGAAPTSSTSASTSSSLARPLWDNVSRLKSANRDRVYGDVSSSNSSDVSRRGDDDDVGGRGKRRGSSKGASPPPSPSRLGKLFSKLSLGGKGKSTKGKVRGPRQPGEADSDDSGGETSAAVRRALGLPPLDALASGEDDGDEEDGGGEAGGGSSKSGKKAKKKSGGVRFNLFRRGGGGDSDDGDVVTLPAKPIVSAKATSGGGGATAGSDVINSDSKPGADPTAATIAAVAAALSVGAESTVSALIQDVPRTFPELAFFSRGSPYRRQLVRILLAYSAYRPDHGYLQGMTHLVALLILTVGMKVAVVMTSAGEDALVPSRRGGGGVSDGSNIYPNNRSLATAESSAYSSNSSRNSNSSRQQGQQQYSAASNNISNSRNSRGSPQHSTMSAAVQLQSTAVRATAMSVDSTELDGMTPRAQANSAMFRSAGGGAQTPAAAAAVRYGQSGSGSGSPSSVPSSSSSSSAAGSGGSGGGWSLFGMIGLGSSDPSAAAAGGRPPSPPMSTVYVPSGRNRGTGNAALARSYALDDARQLTELAERLMPRMPSSSSGSCVGTMGGGASAQPYASSSTSGGGGGSVSESEAVVFTCLANLLSRPPLRFLVARNAQGLARWYGVYWHCLQRVSPPTWAMMTSAGAHPGMYLNKWTMTLFTRPLGLQTAARLWDRILLGSATSGVTPEAAVAIGGGAPVAVALTSVEVLRVSLALTVYLLGPLLAYLATARREAGDPQLTYDVDVLMVALTRPSPDLAEAEHDIAAAVDRVRLSPQELEWVERLAWS